jgi:hypothetical protein
MNATLPQFDRWLKRATRGLARDVAALVREELTAHFEDAVAEYVSEGMTHLEAQQAALHDLGDDSEVAEGFQQTHGAGRHYLIAAVLGMSYPALYLLSIPFNERIAGTMVFNLAIFLPLLYVAYSFKVVLAQRPHGANFLTYERIIHTGIVAMCVPRLVGWLVYHQPIIAEAYTRAFGDAHSMNEWLLNAVALSGLFIAAVGFIGMGERVLHLRERLYGLLRPAGLLAMGCGMGLALYCVGVLVGNSTLREVSEMAAVVTGMITVVLWSVIFFRARSEMVMWA